MKDEQCQFLSLLGRAPLRLTAEQTAWVLNCQPHDIPVLVAARLLKPLGNPLANGTKFFSTEMTNSGATATEPAAPGRTPSSFHPPMRVRRVALVPIKTPQNWCPSTPE